MLKVNIGEREGEREREREPLCTNKLKHVLELHAIYGCNGCQTPVMLGLIP